MENEIALDIFEKQRERSNQLISEYKKKQIGEISYESYIEMSNIVDRMIKREEWENGKIPTEFIIRKKFIYAKTFLQSLDAIQKLINVLSLYDDVPDEVGIVKSEFKKDFKSLRKIRNSGQHLEDRIRGIGSKGAKLDLKPIDSGGIKSDGKTLVINNLNGYTFGTTIDTGEYAEIDVTLNNLTKIREYIQRIINSFKWVGSRMYFPN